MSEQRTKFIFSSGNASGTGPTKEILRIVPNETGWDVVIPHDVTLTEAAQKFIDTVNGMLGQVNG